MTSLSNFASLHKASMRGHESAVGQLLTEGADPSAKDAEGRTPLHHAVMRGHLGVVDRLLEHGGPSLLLSKDILGCTPIHLAAVQNQVMLIMKLVAALAKDDAGSTPLHEVVRRGCMQDFMGFLHLGWDIATAGDPHDQPLAASSPAWAHAAGVINLERPGFRIVQNILGWGPLHVAAIEGHVSLMQSLVQDYGCDILCRSANSWTPLHYAAAYNQVAAIETLVSLGCDVAVKDSVSCTPLHVASGEGHLQAILKLVQLGCEPAVKDRDGCTPLYCAAAWNRIEAVRLLEQLGCPSWLRSEEGRTAVHVAAEQGWLDLLDFLVNDLENKVDVRDAYQFTPLHSAANGGHVRTIQKLVQYGHEVYVKDYLGRTPLHYAATHGRVGAIEELLNQSANLHEQDFRGGYTPLHLAADAGQCEAIVKLVQLGADCEAQNSKGWTPLVLATVKGPLNVDAIRTLVELGADVATVLDQPNIETPLHVAARSGRVDVVEKLLRCGVSVNARTKDGSTALHYAAAFGQTHVLAVLVEAGCPVDARDNAQNTPLHLAAGCGFLETVVRLIQLGADVNARDITECTPLQNAAHGTYSALANMPNSTDDTNRTTSPQPGALTNAQNLTPNQQATQAALANHAAAKKGNLVPVRTGLAWATFGMQTYGQMRTNSGSTKSQLLSGMYMGLDGEHSDMSDWRGIRLMQLLKRASKRYASCFPFSHMDSAACRDEKEKEKKERDVDTDFGLETLLRRTEALQLAGTEADRARLVPVAEKLVELRADLNAVDNEGRTALHLASGCGDKNMVLKLIDLGTDVNCKDSVGGTPMHHAAMANKKEIMFMLARLGCDWRAKAEGIDGATAAFVLCGQHGKTTRQQKLLEAKLKRVHMEGQAARSAGKNPLADDWGNDDAMNDDDWMAATLLADQNMAALLEEEQNEGGRDANGGAKKKKKKKKGKGKAALENEPLQALDLDGNDADDLAPAGARLLPNGIETISFQLESLDMHHPDKSAVPASPSLHTNGLQLEPLDANRPTSRASMGLGYSTAGSENADAKPSEQDIIRVEMDDVVNLANELIKAGAAAPTEELQATLKQLDGVIDKASQSTVSAKYAKKVRKRLQAAIMNTTMCWRQSENEDGYEERPESQSSAGGSESGSVGWGAKGTGDVSSEVSLQDSCATSGAVVDSTTFTASISAPAGGVLSEPKNASSRTVTAPLEPRPADAASSTVGPVHHTQPAPRPPSWDLQDNPNSSRSSFQQHQPMPRTASLPPSLPAAQGAVLASGPRTLAPTPSPAWPPGPPPPPAMQRQPSNPVPPSRGWAVAPPANPASAAATAPPARFPHQGWNPLLSGNRLESAVSVPLLTDQQTGKPPVMPASSAGATAASASHGFQPFQETPLSRLHSSSPFMHVPTASKGSQGGAQMLGNSAFGPRQGSGRSLDQQVNVPSNGSLTSSASYYSLFGGPSNQVTGVVPSGPADASWGTSLSSIPDPSLITSSTFTQHAPAKDGKYFQQGNAYDNAGRLLQLQQQQQASAQHGMSAVNSHEQLRNSDGGDGTAGLAPRMHSPRPGQLQHGNQSGNLRFNATGGLTAPGQALHNRQRSVQGVQGHTAGSLFCFSPVDNLQGMPQASAGISAEQALKASMVTRAQSSDRLQPSYSAFSPMLGGDNHSFGPGLVARAFQQGKAVPTLGDQSRSGTTLNLGASYGMGGYDMTAANQNVIYGGGAMMNTTGVAQMSALGTDAQLQAQLRMGAKAWRSHSYQN